MNLHNNLKKYLETFVSKNDKFEDFKRLSLHPFSEVMTGSRVPYFEKDIKFYDELLTLFQNLEFIEHKNSIRKSIKSLEKEIQEELKKEFIESAFK